MARPISLENFSGPQAAPAAAPDEAMAAAVPEPGVEMPEPPEVDREAERNAALARLASALETVAAEQAALRAASLRQAADAFGNAAAEVLPALARTGFAALVAETARAIAQNGSWPELVVSVAEDQASEVADCLSGIGFSPELRVEARPGMAPGEAEIAWQGGGAEIDAAAIADTLLADFRRELEALAQSGATSP